MNVYQSVPDYFERARPLQPKLAIGEYVESQGIPVPTRYETLEDANRALASGKTVIGRSEHPDEYAGASGVGISKIFRPYQGAEIALADMVLRPNLKSVYGYAVETGIDPEQYALYSSTSMQEYIQGINATVVEDDVVRGRYHIFGYGHNQGDGPASFASGAIVEADGTIINSNNTNSGAASVMDNHKRLIEQYEKVRNLSRFDPNHCPIIEMQISDADDKIYFLQYHRSRDRAPATPSLDLQNYYTEEEGWLPADSVRGVHLGQDVVKLVLSYAKSKPAGNMPEVGHSYFGSGDPSVNQNAARSRAVDIIPQDMDSTYRQIANSHGARDRMFKPQATLLVKPETAEKIIPLHVRRHAHEMSEDLGVDVYVKLRALSDGETGVIEKPEKHTLLAA